MKVLDMAWSDVHAKMKCRWATPRFIKHGIILSRKDRSLTVQFWSEERPTVIPDARWYFVQAKMHGPDAEEHLVIVDEFDDIELQREDRRAELDDYNAHELIITVNQACELLQMDPKQLRRHIRRGTITASKNIEGQWLMRRDLLMAKAAKYGWV